MKSFRQKQEEKSARLRAERAEQARLKAEEEVEIQNENKNSVSHEDHCQGTGNRLKGGVEKSSDQQGNSGRPKITK